MDAKLYAIILLCAIHLINTQQSSCPQQCKCLKTTVVCTNLTEVPSEIPSNTKILDIRHGNISTLHRISGTANVHTLILHVNRIANIDAGFFQSLPQLRYIYLNE